MTALATIKRNGYPCPASEFWWLIDRVTELEAALRAIAEPDELLDANESAFNAGAARRMQTQAAHALKVLS